MAFHVSDYQAIDGNFLNCLTVLVNKLKSSSGNASSFERSEISGNSSPETIEASTQIYLNRIRELTRISKAISVGRQRLFEISIEKERWNAALQILKRECVVIARDINETPSNEAYRTSRIILRKKTKLDVPLFNYFLSNPTLSIDQWMVGHPEKRLFNEPSQSHKDYLESFSTTTTPTLSRTTTSFSTPVASNASPNKEPSLSPASSIHTTETVEHFITPSHSSSATTFSLSTFDIPVRTEPHSNYRESTKRLSDLIPILLQKLRDVITSNVLEKDYALKRARQNRTALVHQAIIKLLCEQQARHCLFITTLHRESRFHSALKDHIHRATQTIEALILLKDSSPHFFPTAKRQTLIPSALPYSSLFFNWKHQKGSAYLQHLINHRMSAIASQLEERPIIPYSISGGYSTERTSFNSVVELSSAPRINLIVSHLVEQILTSFSINLPALFSQSNQSLQHSFVNSVQNSSSPIPSTNTLAQSVYLYLQVLKEKGFSAIINSDEISVPIEQDTLRKLNEADSLTQTKLVERLKSFQQIRKQSLSSFYSLWPIRSAFLHTLYIQSFSPLEHCLLPISLPIVAPSELFAQISSRISSLKVDHIFVQPQFIQAMDRLLRTKEYIQQLSDSAQELLEKLMTYNSVSKKTQESTNIASLQNSERQIFVLFFKNPEKLKAMYRALQQKVQSISYCVQDSMQPHR
ncbi:uncharacterized protein MONOS_13485 [Monocercomonoides exilis]|uniref:uncharacterized protein n=1 Tax=Monocercomonoides exilis TaxID=2049356 RepID=UPI00355949D9|nr:hypothetical protein MONOS_13485 [Monocercomonoides exilis]|eukprot:MONOS_13485.1-p1 / transcript=MONOS_13485.1 / gene=MONOS_13485 / organism=Monocercomonoides_exilis_PA203 / gene_product=unspecified product / transcript_product=unspecified product / location=Mono_scaffold00835:21388-23728(+) / protein_length=696 / sequence_SO=supercontig / SO=protein_coding / is_pseudo=false